MKRCDDRTAKSDFARTGRYISTGFWAMFLLFLIGCATAPPKPVTIKHEHSPRQSGSAVPDKQLRQEPVEQKATVPADQSKKALTNAGESAGAPEQLAAGAAGEKGSVPAPEAVAASGASSEGNKTVIAVPSAGDKSAAAASDANNMDRGEKSTDPAMEELKKRLQEQVKSEITASVVEELKKSLREEITSEITATIAQELKNNIYEEVRSDVMNELLRELWKVNQAIKEKDQRLRFSGDIRLRYESDRFDKNNFNEGIKVSQGTAGGLQNTFVNQDLFKYRVRFGTEAKVNEKVDAVIRLSTGTTSNPVSTNTTMNDYMNKDSVLFDLAYLKWKPSKSFTLYLGRMPNPFFSPDELVWDADLNFEGLALNVRKPDASSFTPFLTIGAFPLQQQLDPLSSFDYSQHGKWLYAGQVGLERKEQKGASVKIGAAYYAFKNIEGTYNDTGVAGVTDWSAPLFTQGFYNEGNTLFPIDPATNKVGLASKFREINLTGTLDIGFWDPVHVVFLVDYVKNIGFKKGDVFDRAHQGPDYDPPKEVEGYQAGMTIGYPTIQESGQWKVYFYSKKVERDAVVDAFTDSDFHLGGTNAKGWILGTDYGLSKNYWLTLRWLTANEISGPPVAIDVLQVDVNARF